ncbi:MAG: helix-turn-helix domain-containing protein [Rhodothermales bacterium]
MLTLKHAADLLSVHPATLRRWADKGDILVVVTPGGHRRFPRSEIERLARWKTGHKNRGLEQLWGEQALTRTRAEIAEHRQDRWLAHLDEKDRNEQREMGRRVMKLIEAFLSSEDNGQDLLEEARRVGHTYAEQSQRAGLGLSETLQATMFFRNNLVESALVLPETVQVRPEANKRLLRRINTYLNAILLGVAETYEQ